MFQFFYNSTKDEVEKPYRTRLKTIAIYLYP